MEHFTLKEFECRCWCGMPADVAQSIEALVSQVLDPVRSLFGKPIKVTSERRDSVRLEQVVVAVHDTIVEVTTILVQTNAAGDTVKVDKVTDRSRTSTRDRVRDKTERVAVRTDTVFVEKRDSVFVRAPSATEASGGSTLVRSLKWIFWIVIGVLALVLVFKFSKVFKFFI